MLFPLLLPGYFYLFAPLLLPGYFGPPWASDTLTQQQRSRWLSCPCCSSLPCQALQPSALPLPALAAPSLVPERGALSERARCSGPALAGWLAAPPRPLPLWPAPASLRAAQQLCALSERRSFFASARGRAQSGALARLACPPALLPACPLALAPCQARQAALSRPQRPCT